jgi:hypothetical protein
MTKNGKWRNSSDQQGNTDEHKKIIDMRIGAIHSSRTLNRGAAEKPHGLATEVTPPRGKKGPVT